MPDFFADENIAMGRLVRLLERFEIEPVGNWAVCPQRRRLNPKVRLAVERLADAMTT